VGENHPGRTRLEAAGAKADRIVAEELARLRWTVKQIAERLRLGKPKGARTNLHKFMNRSGAGGSQPQFDFQRAMKTKGLLYGLTPPPNPPRPPDTPGKCSVSSGWPRQDLHRPLPGGL